MSEKEIAVWLVGAVAVSVLGLLVKRFSSGLVTAVLEFPKLSDAVTEIKKETAKVPGLVSDVERLKGHDFHALHNAVHQALLRLDLREKEMDRAIDRMDRLEETTNKTLLMATETNANVRALTESVAQINERLSAHTAAVEKKEGE